jgi:hypothetical protein
MPDDVFLSYTHVKDEYKAVSLFRKHLETELRKKTGNVTLTLFQDKDGIRGGDNWEERLRSELKSARVLLILVSPTWLKSDWCRREYEIYRDASPSGAPRPIVPILWDSVEESDLATHELDIYHKLRRLQMVEWGELQYEDWSDPKLQKAVSRLASDVKKKLRKPPA